MSISMGRGGGLGGLVRLIVLGALIGAVLNSKDIQRYLRIRSM
ncbi:MAG: hypothetical protein ACREN2_09555 [Candidatus Dormibacteria bacterium]